MESNLKKIDGKKVLTLTNFLCDGDVIMLKSRGHFSFKAYALENVENQILSESITTNSFIILRPHRNINESSCYPHYLEWVLNNFSKQSREYNSR